MDQAYTCLQAGRTLDGMQSLVHDLQERRTSLTNGSWKDFISSQALTHPVRDWVHSDPFTQRSFDKPRGYPGDAELIDHIYGTGSASRAPHPASMPGQIYFYTTTSPTCRAVRFRRRYMARLIDEVVSNVPNARVLSIAAGHLREIELCKMLPKDGVSITALDQDESSVAVVSNEYARLGVETIRGTVREILSGRLRLTNFDLVYAGGLFDYLSEPVARRLVEIMFEALNPGGKLMFANFLPNIPDVGYMESFMDWWLIYRTESELADLAKSISRSEMASLQCTRDPDQNIAFLTLRKK